MKLLIVEDDPHIRDMYRFKFTLENFTVALSDNGKSGLQTAKEFVPDLILLDLKMPVMDGAEMLQQLRRTDWGASMRVIILTNISRDEAPSVLRFLNVDRYIVKAHHTPAQVVDIVRDVLRL